MIENINNSENIDLKDSERQAVEMFLSSFDFEEDDEELEDMDIDSDDSDDEVGSTEIVEDDSADFSDIF